MTKDVNTKYIVNVHVFKGRILRDEKGNIASPNHTQKLHYLQPDWELFKKTCSGDENTTAQILWVKKQTATLKSNTVDGKQVPYYDYKHEKVDTPEEIKTAFAEIFKKKDVEMSPQDKKIAELEAKILALSESKEEKTSTLEAKRAEYTRVVGKKPHHTWDEVRMDEKIAEFLKDAE